LANSKSYLEDALSASVRWMALPGGKGNAQVLNCAASAGYALVGNSVADLNRHVGLSVNRPCVTSEMGAKAPLRWATAGSRYWLTKRFRRGISALGLELMGEQRYILARDMLKKIRFK
jgi:hypothetical protein